MNALDRNSNARSFAAQHALFWLMIGNAVGLWLALLLIFPQLNGIFGEITYGRILPVHLNVQLYGWTSLPLIAWLFYLYRTGDGWPARAAILTWSAALAIGCLSWLTGHSSGKIFLEWAGFPRVFFAFAMLFLWCVVAADYWQARRFSGTERWLRFGGLAALLAVAPIWFWAASPRVYPAVNPHTAGPTAASLLGSTLIVILLLLVAAPLLGTKKPGRAVRRTAWILFAAELAIFVFCAKGNASHRSTPQLALLSLLLVWAPILPLYFNRLSFPEPARPWIRAALVWFGLLAITGWVSFLPNVLDSWKFTNALVAHSHLAMAGFVSTFNLFLLACMGEIRAPRATVHAWNIATLLYLLAMWAAGTFEALDPAFTIQPGHARTFLYALRSLAGLAMLGCSMHWWMSTIKHPAASVQPQSALTPAPA